MKNKKIVSSTKTTSAIFLATVLIAGTIVSLFPSFMVVGVEAQAQPYYDGDSGMDNKYNSYGQMEYPSKYTDRKSYETNSYEPTTAEDYGNEDYGNDNNDRKSYETNSYEPTTAEDYGNDNNDRKSYESTEYSSKYTDSNSYEPTTAEDYGNDNN